MSSRYWEGMTKGTLNLKYSYEFWATCFEAYILCRDDLKKCCPEAYKYMHNIIYNLEKEYEKNIQNITIMVKKEKIRLKNVS